MTEKITMRIENMDTGEVKYDESCLFPNDAELTTFVLVKHVNYYHHDDDTHQVSLQCLALDYLLVGLLPARSSWTRILTSGVDPALDISARSLTDAASRLLSAAMKTMNVHFAFATAPGIAGAGTVTAAFSTAVFGAQFIFAIVIKKPSFGLARRVNMWREIVKNGGALQRLVANKYIGEKKKGVSG